MSEVIFILGIAYLANQLKHIPKEFNIMNELFAICWIRAISTTLRYVLIFEYFNYDMLQRGPIIYIVSLLDASCSIVTGLIPLVMTYKPNQIIPFPINEDCISNFVVAIIMPTSMTHFYQYLQNLPDFEEALIIFGLHADIRIYMRMHDEHQVFSTEQIHSKAVQIFEDYIIEDCKWAIKQQSDGYLSNSIKHNSSESSTLFQASTSPIPDEILREIRAGFNNGKIRFMLNSGLFSDLYIFTLERLRQYYEQFKQSQEFGNLREEVIS